MSSKEFKSRIVILSPKIYPMAARLLNNDDDARDAVQDVMLKLWKRRKKLCSHENLNGFVFLCAKNHCLDVLRRRKRNGSNLEINSTIIENAQSSNNIPFENDEAYKIITKAINELPENQREVIQLRDIDGLEFDEIVALTGFKIENIRVWLSRARKKISEELTEIYNYERGTGR